MVTAQRLSDEQIRELEIEAERLSDIEVIRERRRAYRRVGGGANPCAPERLVALLNQRGSLHA